MTSYLINYVTREVIEEIGDGWALEEWVNNKADSMKLVGDGADNSKIACIDRLSKLLYAESVGIRIVGAVKRVDTGEPVVEDCYLAASIHSDWELIDIDECA